MMNKSAPASKVKKSRNMLKVLILDDDPLDLEIASDVVKSLGIRDVTAVSSGVAALQRISASKLGNPFDVMLCDLQMPEMDGFQLLESMAESGFGGSIIIVSGQKANILRSATLVAELRRFHVLASVSKPLTKEALAAVLT